MKRLSIWMPRLGPALKEAWPYVALFALPGGSLIALTAWVARHWPLAKART
jgi:hypothetical protein